MTINTKILQLAAQAHRDVDAYATADLLRDAAATIDTQTAEIASLRKALTSCAAIIQRDREELERCAIDPRTGKVPPGDTGTLEGIEEYEAVLTVARAALPANSQRPCRSCWTTSTRCGLRSGVSSACR